MSKLRNVIGEIHSLEALQAERTLFTALHPLAKLIVTVGYILVLMSFGKYDLAGLLAMLIYPLLGFHLGKLSWREGLWRLRFVLPIVGFVGIANPFFDKQSILLGSISVQAGFLSFLTLMLKGVLAVLASYLLIATTRIEQLCYALRLLCLPRLLVTLFLFIYRYIILLLEEAERISQAYALRAPRQQGLSIKVWGSLVGHFLLRSVDRATSLYAAMLLRGYRGEFYYCGEGIAWKKQDWLLVLGFFLAVLLIKCALDLA